MTAKTMVISRTTVTRALISGVKPTRIIAHRRSGKRHLVAGDKGADQRFVERQRERKHGPGHDGGCQMRHQNMAQGLPAARAEIEGGLDQRTGQGLQPREHQAVGHGKHEDRVAQDHGRKATVQAHLGRSDKQGKSGDDGRQQERAGRW